MWVIYSIVSWILILGFVGVSEGENFDDTRCRCLCPSPTVVNGTDLSNRLQYIGNVPPNKCNCEGVVLPRLGTAVKDKEREFCPRCDCKFEHRNTNMIKCVVIFVIWVISLLCIYMLFLMCLDPLLNKRVKGNYQEHTNEEDEAPADAGTSTPSVEVVTPGPSVAGGNVLNRVGHQQDKWKKQVREQRKIIYDKHTMLN